MGLGNPGDRYAGTRHNVGFDVVDELAGRAGARVDRLDCRALTARTRLAGAPVILAKPQTYMNISGESVKGLTVKYDVGLDRLLVISDEVAIPIGKLRVRGTGSSGGQKGLQNVIDCLKTKDFPRLRVGVAGSDFRPGDELSDYVLSRFSKAERSLHHETVVNAADAVEAFVEKGLDAAMSRFNRSGDIPPS